MTANKTAVGIAIPARYARKYGCLHIAPSSQVIQQRRDAPRKKQNGGAPPAQRHPAPPRHTQRWSRKPLQHRWPKVAAELRLAHRRQRLLQQLFHLFHVTVTHGCTPAADNSFRKILRPRKTRTFTAFTEIPS